MLRFYLIFNTIIILGNFLSAQDNKLEEKIIDSTDSISVVIDKSNYPGKPLIMSLILPGTGQYYNKSPMWKTLSFMGVEITSWLLWKSFNDRAENLKDDYEEYADNHWTLNNWINNRFNPTSIQHESISWTNFPALNKLTGTHHLNISITGDLANDLNLTYVSSDSLEIHPDWVESGDIQVSRDRHFYENIGKYDQFLGGWSDANSDWYWEEKDVGDSTEIIIKTPLKADYIEQRYQSNQMLNMAKYSITVIMFNHVFSGIESVWSNQKNARSNNEIDTDLSLIYNPINSSGVGGLSFTIRF
tara:strand:+ start:340 stop:1245 length:906 start_codon:yes stop_codon:yes gene_type:complete